MPRKQGLRLPGYGDSEGDHACHFTPVMREALRQHGLPLIARMLTDGSPLIDAGFVDPDGHAPIC